MVRYVLKDEVNTLEEQIFYANKQQAYLAYQVSVDRYIKDNDSVGRFGDRYPKKHLDWRY